MSTKQTSRRSKETGHKGFPLSTKMTFPPSHGAGNDIQEREPVGMFVLMGRAINERIAAHGHGKELVLVCECADGDCDALIRLTPQQYRKVRQGDSFVVKQGHGSSPTDRILAGQDSWLIVGEPDALKGPLRMEA